MNLVFFSFSFGTLHQKLAFPNQLTRFVLVDLPLCFIRASSSTVVIEKCASLRSIYWFQVKKVAHGTHFYWLNWIHVITACMIYRPQEAIPAYTCTIWHSVCYVTIGSRNKKCSHRAGSDRALLEKYNKRLSILSVLGSYNICKTLSYKLITIMIGSSAFRPSKKTSVSCRY